MKAKHLSRAQATAICHDYQHLTGTLLDGGHSIDLILVAPYSRILQWKFVQDVLQEQDDLNRVSPDNPAGRYEVLLVSRAANRAQSFITKDLRSHLAAQTIPFNEGRYSRLRRGDASVKACGQFSLQAVSLSGAEEKRC